MTTVKVKEARQLLLANRLLLFTLSLFLVLLPQRKFMVMEHPSCPGEDHEHWMASVWKMYIIRCFLRHRDVQILNIYQGKFGGASPKPTTLMVLCGRDIDVRSHLGLVRRSVDYAQGTRYGLEGGQEGVRHSKPQGISQTALPGSRRSCRSLATEEASFFWPFFIWD